MAMVQRLRARFSGPAKPSRGFRATGLAGFFPCAHLVVDRHSHRAGEDLMDNSFLKEQVARCRDLASVADPFTKQRLLDLVTRYEEMLRNHAGVTRQTKLPSVLPHTLPKALPGVTAE
jgi:hypothetical protein